jgi:hypothetical protein
MSITRLPGNHDTSPTRDILNYTRYSLNGRRGLIMLAVVALAVGLVLNWNWLVAADLAPLLLSVLPCVAMCAIGLCVNRMTGKSCSVGTDAATRATESVPLQTPLAVVSVQPLHDRLHAPMPGAGPAVEDSLMENVLQPQIPDERK